MDSKMRHTQDEGSPGETKPRGGFPKWDKAKTRVPQVRHTQTHTTKTRQRKVQPRYCSNNNNNNKFEQIPEIIIIFLNPKFVINAKVQNVVIKTTKIKISMWKLTRLYQNFRNCSAFFVFIENFQSCKVSIK